MEYERIVETIRRADAGLADSLGKLERSVAEWWQVPYLPWFTDHGPSHSRRVVEYVLKLLPVDDDGSVPLAPLELYIVCAAAWAHDLGMQVLLEREAKLGELTTIDHDAIRADHPRQSFEAIIANARELGLPDDPEVMTAIALVAQAHGTKFFSETTAKLAGVTSVRNQPVRGPLLAALLLFADELDLHYERARFPPSSQAVLNSTSRAHNFKHHYISRVALRRNGIGETEVRLDFTFPRSLNLKDRDTLVRWVTTKLQTQVGLVQPYVLAGLRGQLRLSRAIAITLNEEIAPVRQLVDSECLHVIAEDNFRNLIVDRRAALKSLADALESVRVVGVLGRPEADQDGREDILDWLRLKLMTQGRVVASETLKNMKGGSASDVLNEWLTALDVRVDRRSNELQQRRHSMKALMSALPRFERLTLIASSLDALPAADQSWLIQRCASELLQASPGIAFAFTSDLDATWAGQDSAYLLRLGTPNADEVEEYFRRFDDGEQGQLFVRAGLDYSALKRLAAGYELTLQERSTSWEP